MATTLYPNGQIPQSALRPVPAARGQTAWLLPGPAESLHRVLDQCQRRHGWRPLVTSAGDGFRSYARQVTVFLQRYRRIPSTVLQRGRRIVDQRTWNDAYARAHGLAGVYYRYTGPAAAVPGTSNHGKGITVDLTPAPWFDTDQYDDLEAILIAEGWSDREGRGVSEPWHKNYTQDAYEVVDTNLLPGVDITTPDGRLPELLIPLPKEDDMLVYAGEAGIYWLSGGRMKGCSSAMAAEIAGQPGIPYVHIDTPERAREWLRDTDNPVVLIRDTETGNGAASIDGSGFGWVSAEEYQGHLNQGAPAFPVSPDTYKRLTDAAA